MSSRNDMASAVRAPSNSTSEKLPEMWLPRILRFKRITMRGFIVSDFAELQPDFLRDMTTWIAEGHVKYREDIVEGLNAAPEVFYRSAAGAQYW